MKDTLLEYADRRGSGCYKWDCEEAAGTLPLWVADMDFKAAKPIVAAMQRRLEHGVFGYQMVPQENYDAVASWFSRRHGWKGINSTNLLYTTAVVPAISAIFKALQMRQESTLRVLTFTPAYNCFFSCIRNMCCRLVASPLVLKGNRFEIDFDDVARKAKEADVLLLCNPHNPTGRVWTRAELEQLADIARREQLFVLSDEIHCEFAFPGHTYTPFAIVAANDADYCVCTSASKAFNIAGLQCANIFAPDAEVFECIHRALEIHEVGELNPFGLVAQAAAYNDSEAWLDELNAYIYGNYCYLRDFLRDRLPVLQLTEMEGTYLAWVNIAAMGVSAETLCADLAKTIRVLFNPAEMYGAEGFIRINLATSREVLQEALNRLENFIQNLNSKNYTK